MTPKYEDLISYRYLGRESKTWKEIKWKLIGSTSGKGQELIIVDEKGSHKFHHLSRAHPNIDLHRRLTAH
jgi:hypothetical protein